MNDQNSIVNVIRIIRDFMQNEGQTLDISKGKMLNDREAQMQMERILRTG